MCRHRAKSNVLPNGCNPARSHWSFEMLSNLTMVIEKVSSKLDFQSRGGIWPWISSPFRWVPDLYTQAPGPFQCGLDNRIIKKHYSAFIMSLCCGIRQTWAQSFSFPHFLWPLLFPSWNGDNESLPSRAGGRLRRIIEGVCLAPASAGDAGDSGEDNEDGVDILLSYISLSLGRAPPPLVIAWGHFW